MVALIAPSAAYTGTDGTGFGGIYTAEPTASALRLRTDRVRPTLVPFYPDRQGFIADHYVDFVAAEGGGGNATWPGMPASVDFILEGTTVNVAAPSLNTIVGDDGVSRTAWTYRIGLNHAAFDALPTPPSSWTAQQGWVRLYVRANSNDPTNRDPRILGPFLYKRKTGSSVWDQTLTFGPGNGSTIAAGTYASLSAALIAAKALTTVDHIRLRPVSTYTDTSSLTNTGTSTRKGIIAILPWVSGDTVQMNGTGAATAAGDVVLTFTKAASPNSTLLVRPWTEGLTWGRGVRIDQRYFKGFQQDAVGGVTMRPMHFAGVDFINSHPDGAWQMDGSGDASNKLPRSSGLFATPQQWVTECTIQNVGPGPGNTNMRWTTINGQFGNDIFSITATGYKSLLFYGNTVNATSCAYVREGTIIGLTAQFTPGTGGTGLTTATITKQLTPSNALLFHEDGVLKATYTVSNTIGTNTPTGTGGGTFFLCSDVVADINAHLPGWTASIGTQSGAGGDLLRFAAIFTSNIAALDAVSPTTHNAFNVAKSLNQGIDVHLDGHQMPNTSTGKIENFFSVNNTMKDGYDLAALFLAASTSNNDLRDVAIFNNIYHLPVQQTRVTQLNGYFSHLLVWHNTFFNQSFTTASSPAFSNWTDVEISNNCADQFTYGGAATSSARVTDNHGVTGAPPTTGATVFGNTVTGTTATCFPGAGVGIYDMTPAGALLSELAAPRIFYDHTNALRDALSAKGAVRATSETASASPDPTSIAVTCPLSAGETAQPFTITATLNQVATADTTITWAKSGVSGSFSSATTVIATGSISGQVVFTPTTAGTASITVTNNRSLTNPSALTLAITLASPDPVSFTQSLSASSIVLGQSLTVTYTLDVVATAPVTITPAFGIAGTLLSGPTVLIPFGAQTGVANFLPSVIGSGSATATDNLSLTDPAAAAFTVTRAPTTAAQLIVLGLVH